MLNEYPVQPTVRQPRGLVRVNNKQNLPWESFEVENNNFYSADTFRVTIPVGSLPQDYQPSWFAEQQQMILDIYAGFPPNPDHYVETDLLFLIHGYVDEVDYDPIAGTITISGRDHTSLLIDNKTDEKFTNQTSSQIATTLAKRRGLTPVVTATKTPAGRYYVIDSVNMTRMMTEWDILTWLAQQEGYQVYVTGNELHFEPKDDSGDGYVLVYDGDKRSFNGMRLRLSHNLTLAKDVIVKVRSFSFLQGTALTKIARAKHSKSDSPPQTYVYSFPNLTADQAQKKATALALQISQHELRLEATLPGDAVLTTRMPVELRGTSSIFDQTYFPDRVIRRFDANDGFVMELFAKNHATESMVTA